jgi:hypothetical protein
MAAAFRGAGDEAVHDVVAGVVASLGTAGPATRVPFRLLVAGARAAP